MPSKMSMSNSTLESNGGLPEYVNQNYYRYGLLVATHPKKIIFIACLFFFGVSYPLLYLPLPGYLPQEFFTEVHNYSVPAIAEYGGIMLSPSPVPKPLWYQGPPAAYIQQVVVRSGVDPNPQNNKESTLSVSDSYRGPLSTVFNLYRTISNYHTDHNNKDGGVDQSLTKECLLVDDVAKQHRKEGGTEGLLPHFNCLLLSPADLWTRDRNEFLRDPHVLTTVKSLTASYEGQTKVANILFGVPSSDVGLCKKTHPNAITYSLTIALKSYSEKFVDGLKEELVSKYPLHKNQQPTLEQMRHLYFPSQLSPWELLFCVFYCSLFLSIYFSLRKMDMLFSQMGVSFAVLVTHIASLCLAVGTCAYFGMRPLHSQAKFLYPVLAGLVGFENSMVLIRSIASIPHHLDVKIRVARGLANEGWTITKYFLIMITLVTISFFLFIPIVQEICIYGSIVLLCDLYMQLVFLTAVISIDIQRRRESNQNLKREVVSSTGVNRPALIKIINSELNQPGRTGIPNLHRRNAHLKPSHGEDRLAPPSSVPTKATSGIPKRLRITYFVTSKRMLQRALMCSFVFWTTWIIYSTSGLSEFLEQTSFDGPGLASVIKSIKVKSNQNFLVTDNKSSNVEKFAPGVGTKTSDQLQNSAAKTQHFMKKADSKNLNAQSKWTDVPLDEHTPFTQLRHEYPDLSYYLPATHWPTLFGYYNISLKGQYITFLPPILLSVPVTVQEALAVHNPEDPNKDLWQPPVDLDPSDSKFESVWQWWVALMSQAFRSQDGRYSRHHLYIIPSSSGQMIFGVFFGIPTLLTLVYTLVWMYRCCCSKNYSEWRDEWFENEAKEAKKQIIKECVPVSLCGHPSDIECLSTDGYLVASTCLSGVVKVWDPVTSECLNTLDRTHHNKHFHRHKLEEQLSSDYESGSPVSMPDYYYSSASQTPGGSIWQVHGGTPTAEYEFQGSPSDGSRGLADFKPTINTNFLSMYSPPNGSSRPQQPVRRLVSSDSLFQLDSNGVHSRSLHEWEPPAVVAKGHKRNFSADSQSLTNYQQHHKPSPREPTEEAHPSVWALQCHDGLIFVGCSDGSIEVWDGYSGNCKFVTPSGDGVTHLAVSGSTLVTARLSGFIDIYKMNVRDNFSATKETHTHHRRTSSYDKCVETSSMDSYEMHLTREASKKAHPQPMSVLCCDDQRVLTGSLDHTLKVFELRDARNLFTLHGHAGPITTATLGGPVSSSSKGGEAVVNITEHSLEGAIIASGAQDGSLSVWDAVTGTCVYSVTGHAGPVLSIVTSSSYLISLGADEKLAVWERFQGHLLNTLHLSHQYCSSILMLTPKLLLSTQQGALCVIDVSSGVEVLEVSLGGETEEAVYPRQLLAVGASIICDYGHNLRTVRMPVAEKIE